MNWMVIYAAVIGTLLVFDGLWLGLIAKRFYANQLGQLMRKPVLAVPALIFYVLYAVGLVILAVRPNDAATTVGDSAFLGAVVGFIAFGTYNMTNYATLAHWPIKMTAVDWPIGTGLSALACTVGAYTKQWIM